MMQDSLIDSWLATELSIPGTRRADALRSLNEALGRRYTNQRLNEWLRGDRIPAADAMRYMIEVCIEHVLAQERIVIMDDDALDRIARRLSPPVRS